MDGTVATMLRPISPSDSSD